MLKISSKDWVLWSRVQKESSGFMASSSAPRFCRRRRKKARIDFEATSKALTHESLFGSFPK